ncbi:hypothetical protein LCGC14_2779050, partial [marine sediment metagenome]
MTHVLFVPVLEVVMPIYGVEISRLNRGAILASHQKFLISFTLYS